MANFWDWMKYRYDLGPNPADLEQEQRTLDRANKAQQDIIGLLGNKSPEYVNHPSQGAGDFNRGRLGGEMSDTEYDTRAAAALMRQGFLDQGMQMMTGDQSQRGAMARQQQQQEWSKRNMSLYDQEMLTVAQDKNEAQKVLWQNQIDIANAQNNRQIIKERHGYLKSLNTDYAKTAAPYETSIDTFNNVVRPVIAEQGFDHNDAAADYQLVAAFVKAVDPNTQMTDGEFESARQLMGVGWDTFQEARLAVGKGGLLNERVRRQIYNGLERATKSNVYKIQEIQNRFSNTYGDVLPGGDIGAAYGLPREAASVNSVSPEVQRLLNQGYKIVQ